MSLISIPELKRRFGREITSTLPSEKQASIRARLATGRRILLKESRAAERSDLEFDVFLSHSYADAEQIFYIKRLFERHGHSVYVDWIEDQQVDRSDVDARTADLLRQRIQKCTSLLLAKSVNADSSRWVPWELGYADGTARRVATLPFLETDERKNSHDGIEYLGLYPYVTEEPSTSGRLRLWTRRDNRTYVGFSRWLDGQDPREPNST